MDERKIRRGLDSDFKYPSERAAELYSWLESIRLSDAKKLSLDWRAWTVGLLNVRRDKTKVPHFVRWTGSENVRLKQCWSTAKEPEGAYVRVTIPSAILARSTKLGLVKPSDLSGKKATLSLLVLLAAGRLPSQELPAGDPGETSHLCPGMTICQRHIRLETRDVNHGRGAQGHKRGPGCGHEPACIDTTSSSEVDAWVDWSIELLREACEYLPPTGGAAVTRMRSQYSVGPTATRARWARIPSGVPLESIPYLTPWLTTIQANPPGI